ncbi:MAG: rod shape-determining protein [Abditibacteriota bacterium]|nr:rod shape-determining protein [Abditibacteriota bacterium]MBP5093698.1 rod shape-determining protein [Abditibacteriota bacterium]
MLTLVPEIGIDLGTANILVYLKGKGIVLREPSVVAVNVNTKKLVAIGEEAKAMLGRTPTGIAVVKPMSDGVIADYTVTTMLLEHIVAKVCGRRRMMKPTIIIAVPSEVTQVEKRAVIHAAKNAGAKFAYTIDEPWAAAIGAGMSISSPRGNMVVDMGGGTTDIAVLSLNGIVTSKSVRIAGNKFDEIIGRYIKNNYSLMIGDMTAEEIKVTIGSAYPDNDKKTMKVGGRDLIEGLPKTVEVTSGEIREALKESLKTITEGIRTVLESTPPELSADIIESGIMLTGGSSMLEGLDKLIAEETGVKVIKAEDPLSAVALGCGGALDMMDKLRDTVLSTY